MYYYTLLYVLYIDTMINTNTLIDALKLALQQHGYTYADVAKELALSESSIKRLFNSGNLSLTRLQKICDSTGIDWIDLTTIMEAKQYNLDQLSEEQEQALIDNKKLLLVSFLLLNHWTFDQIIAEYAIDELEGTRLLARLDRLGILDLLPGNKVRMRLARNFSWRVNGPIQQFFESYVQTEFFQAHFDAPNKLRLFLTGMLSKHSLQIIQQRLQRIATEFETLVREDRKLEPKDRQGTTLLLAVRSWELSLFKHMKRKP